MGQIFFAAAYVGPAGDLLPAALQECTRGAVRLGSDYSLGRYEAESSEALRGRFQACGWTVGIGAREIWDRFPLLRGDFLATIRRAGFGGDVSVSRPLREAVWGDVVDHPNVTLPYFPTQGPDGEGATVGLTHSELRAAVPALIEPADPGPRRLDGTVVYICNGLGIERFAGGQLPPGVTCLTPREFIHSTDIMEILKAHSELMAKIGGSFGYAYSMPDDFTCALVIDEDQEGLVDYSTARLTRLLAAVAATTSANGRVLRELRIRGGSRSYAVLENERWGMPFRAARQPTAMVTAADTDFWKACTVLSGSTHSKFVAAKEDYRALALETAGDSRRSGIVPLQLAQVWMAVERLTPFRTEARVQLSLALSALVDAEHRTEEFGVLSESYALRSQIAHGYNFERNEKVLHTLMHIANVFRTLLKLSLQYSDSQALRSRLLEQVLSGQPKALKP